MKGGFSLKNLHLRAHKWGTSDFLYKPSCLWLNLSVCDWPLDGTHLCWRYQRIPVVPMDMPEDIREHHSHHYFSDTYDHCFVVSLFWWKGDFHWKISTLGRTSGELQISFINPCTSGQIRQSMTGHWMEHISVEDIRGYLLCQWICQRKLENTSS